MATHPDYVIANASGAAVRDDLNKALAAIVSNNSSATDPATSTTTYPHQWWYDTIAGQLKLRNAANDGWVVVPVLDSSDRLLVGTSTSEDQIVFGLARMQLKGGDNNESAFLITNTTDGPAGRAANIRTGRIRGTNGAVIEGDVLGQWSSWGYDGSNFAEGSSITAQVDGTPGANDMPGRLVFSTTPDSASTPTERMRIDSGGEIRINTASTILGFSDQKFSVSGPSGFENSGGIVAGFDRKTDDGNIINFYQATTLEGSISVSGTTVSYNGAHLSRWSQLPSGQERTEILRGTVLSNIDEMCEWGEEDNEQLNRMKVSDVEGDKNVSGVFQAWDDDDDTYPNDFYCAMTGDFIIRIAAGTTVERGDLLMSAGDGTAKPQDDDIIRSKTIAKVTSTNVSCTYDDGSYCVPCVLMAC